MAKHILIVGSGSVGKRHAANFAALGCTISAMDPHPRRISEMAAETEVVGAFDSIEEALHVEKTFDGVVIASPPKFHVDQAIEALDAGIPVLLEKPVSPGLEAAERLAAAVQSTGVPLLLGYTWRWWPPLVQVRSMLADDAIGTLRHVRFVMSAHLADWHPWEKVQDWFMASREMGGGALLDESHWVDLALWFFGAPKSVIARIEKISDLEVETDDNVDMVLVYENGLRVSIHLDLYGRPHQKTIRFSGEGGTILWTDSPNRVSVSHEATPGEGGWEETDYTCQRNDMFVDVAKEFLSVVDGAPVNSCTIADGVGVLEVLEAARRSSADDRTVELSSSIAVA
jgi:predicted dehydrogenase